MGPLLLLCMGSSSAVALSGSNYGCLIIAVGGAWGLQHSEEEILFYMVDQRRVCRVLNGLSSQ